MKKIITQIIFLLLIKNLNGQSDFETTDKYAIEWNYSVNSTSEMYDFLDSIDLKFHKEIDKVRVFYIWLVHNIKYDHEKKENTGSSNYYSLYGKNEIELNDYVLKIKKGVCSDYARLFKSMGEYLSLEINYVSGYARTYEDNIKFLRSIREEDTNHAWNYVRLNNRDYFIDATWGVNNYEDDIETYFLITPNKMITTHFPINNDQQYLQKKVTIEQFKNHPYVYKLYKSNYYILDYLPKENITLKKDKIDIRFSLKISQYTDDKFTMILRENENKEDVLVSDQVDEHGNLVINYQLERERNINEIVIYIKENSKNEKKLILYKTN